MAAPRPTFVIVPGAWHRAKVCDQLVSELTASGYTAEAFSLPSVGNKNVSYADDTKAIRQLLLSLVDSGKDVVVVSHSYAGGPSNAAARGLGKSSRLTLGQPGGVIGLVGISAFLVPEGDSLVGMSGGSYAPFVLQNKPSQGFCTMPYESAVETLYAEVDPAMGRKLAASLLPHSMLAFESPAPRPAWAEPEFEGKLGYIKCTKDAAVPVFVQEKMIRDTQKHWIVRELETDHTPFQSRLSETAEILKDWADIFSRKWMKLL